MRHLSETDLGPTAKDIVDPKKNIKKGFVWLGISSIISQGLDALSMLIILIYISKEDLGLATIAIAFAACTEAFCGLGIAPAMVQDEKLSVNETHSLFWFSVLFGIIFFGIILLPLLWPISYFYASTVIIPLLYAGCIKNAIGSCRQVQNALLSRRLQYSVMSRNSIITNILSSCCKILLACLGFGAWSLVLANVLHGVSMLILNSIAAHYIPAMHFKLNECKRFIIFGIKNSGSTLLDVLNKNFHYFIVGKFFGISELAVYRVGYELAMTTPLALLNVVNNSSFPVFSKFKNDRNKLTSLFSWNQSNIAMFSIIPIMFIAFCSEDILSLINNGIWMDATLFIPFILGVAFLKTITQTFPELYRASGHPENTFYMSSLETIFIAISFILTLSACHYFELNNILSLQILFSVWMLLYLPLLMFHKKLSSKFINITFLSMFKSISGSILFFIISFGLCLFPWIYRDSMPLAPWLHISIEVFILLLCLGCYLKWFHNKSGSSTT